MSALGQKQTCAAQNGMSALPPIATAKANSRKRSANRSGHSALSTPITGMAGCCARAASGQRSEGVTAAPPSMMNSRRSFDHLISAEHEAGRYLVPNRLSGLEVNYKLERGGLLDR